MITLLVSLLIFMYLQAEGSAVVKEHLSTSGSGSVVPNSNTADCFGSVGNTLQQQVLQVNA